MQYAHEDLTRKALQALLRRMRGKTFSPELVSEFRQLLPQKDHQELLSKHLALEERMARLEAKVEELTEHVQNLVTDLFKGSPSAKTAPEAW